MKARSTMDAMALVSRDVDRSTSTYCLGVFLNFKGAFDRMWWPGVLFRLHTLENF